MMFFKINVHILPLVSYVVFYKEFKIVNRK